MNYFTSLSSANELVLIIGGLAGVIIACVWIWYYGSQPSQRDSIPGRGLGPEHQSKVIDDDFYQQLHQ